MAKDSKKKVTRKIVPFPSEDDRRVFRQIDLGEERILHHRYIEARNEWKAKRRYIQELLDEGAELESGSRLAKIQTRRALVIN